MRSSMAGRARARGSDLGRSTLRSYAELQPVLATTLVAVALLAAWGLAFAGGGAKTVLPHLFYVGIILAAVRFGMLSAIATAVAAGILAGPLLPADVSTGASQATPAWLTRLAIFTAMAALIAWLTSHSRPSAMAKAKDHKLSVELTSALKAGEVVPYYQPQLDLQSGRVVGAEALARWIHPGKGPIPPHVFIPAAERTGTVGAVDRHILRQAIQELAAWAARGWDELTMSVNISASGFRDPGLVDDAAHALTAAGVNPGNLHVEITETAIIDDVETAARQIEALRKLGVRIAIDDFGAGHSSLSYLHKFEIDVVKIDRGFIVNVPDDARATRLIAGLIRMFESLDIRVVCEGISDADQYVTLQSIRCPVGQGFYLARPAAADETRRWLTDAMTRSHRRRQGQSRTDP